MKEHILRMINRNKEIVKFRKTHNVMETGRQFGLTCERIRQICKQSKK